MSLKMMEDIRCAFRGMRRSPAFTTIAVVTLALGIGINIAVFSITNAVLFKGFRSIDRNDRILYIDTQKDGRGCCASLADFEDWRVQAKSFQGLGAVADLQITVTDGTGTPEHYDASLVTSNAFQLLGVAPIVGRDFASSDQQPGAAPVAILSHAFWQRRYGTDPHIVDQSIRVNGTPTTVIGVMPPDFSFPQAQDVWLPLVRTPDLLKRSNRGLWFAFGRLADGVTFESARAELALVGQQLAVAYPESNEGMVPTPRTFARFFVDVNAPAIYLSLWAAVAFVVLIASANFSNLLLARAIGRSREISVRIALGASRWRIARQVVIESLMLSFAGGALGWWIARTALSAFALVANPPSRAWSAHLLDYTMDSRVVLYALVLAVGAGVLSSLAPAARLLKLDFNAALKEGGRGATQGRRGKRLSASLVVMQLALSVVLVSGAAVMIRSFLNLSTVDLGVKTADVLTGLVNLPAQKYPDSATQHLFFDRLQTRLLALPGVESVTLANVPPASGAPRFPYELAGAPANTERRRPTVSALTIGPSYFQTLGAPLMGGREFTDADSLSGLPAVIVNDQFAKTHWPGEDALGKRLRLFSGNTSGEWLTVVGVASNIVQDVTRQRRDPVVYVPYRQEPGAGMWVFARTRVAPAGLAPAFQREVRALDPDLPVWLGPYPLTERLDGVGAYWTTRNQAGVFLLFALTGLILASVGLYAIVAHAVSERTGEIGLRMAIGATGREILALVLLQGMRPAIIGLVVGLAGSVAVNRLIESQLVQVSATDPLTYLMTSGVLLAFAALGCAIPAFRATRVDPVVALRHQ